MVVELLGLHRAELGVRVVKLPGEAHALLLDVGPRRARRVELEDSVRHLVPRHGPIRVLRLPLVRAFRLGAVPVAVLRRARHPLGLAKGEVHLVAREPREHHEEVVLVVRQVAQRLQRGRRNEALRRAHGPSRLAGAARGCAGLVSAGVVEGQIEGDEGASPVEEDEPVVRGAVGARDRGGIEGLEVEAHAHHAHVEPKAHCGPLRRVGSAALLDVSAHATGPCFRGAQPRVLEVLVGARVALAAVRAQRAVHGGRRLLLGPGVEAVCAVEREGRGRELRDAESGRGLPTALARGLAPAPQGAAHVGALHGEEVEALAHRREERHGRARPEGRALRGRELTCLSVPHSARELGVDLRDELQHVLVN
mmetsp:Transcript_27904/g.75196  ORF Transcript_27904/g.75196 Transcript_27904/m.75196 type:complete len:366 (+) Transcript_27904:839-1936(+)